MQRECEEAQKRADHMSRKCKEKLAALKRENSQVRSRLEAKTRNFDASLQEQESMLSSKLKETYEQRLLEQNEEFERERRERKDALDGIQRQREEQLSASERERDRMQGEIAALKSQLTRLEGMLGEKEENERSLGDELEALRCAANSSDVSLSRLTD